jgi:hypothetical protein
LWDFCLLAAGPRMFDKGTFQARITTPDTEQPTWSFVGKETEFCLRKIKLILLVVIRRHVSP